MRGMNYSLSKPERWHGQIIRWIGDIRRLLLVSRAVFEQHGLVADRDYIIEFSPRFPHDDDLMQMSVKKSLYGIPMNIILVESMTLILQGAALWPQRRIRYCGVWLAE